MSYTVLTRVQALASRLLNHPQVQMFPGRNVRWLITFYDDLHNNRRWWYRNYRWQLAWKAVFYAMMAWISVRVVAMSLVILSGHLSPWEFFRLDPAVGTFWAVLRVGMGRATLAASCSLFPWFVVYTDYLLYGGLRHRFVRWVHYSVVNGSYREAQNGSETNLPKRPKYYPNYSADTLARLAFLIRWGDRLVGLICILVGLVLLTLGLILWNIVWEIFDQGEVYHLQHRVRFLVGVWFMLFATWNAFRVTLAVLYLFSVIVLPAADHQAEWNRRLRGGRNLPKTTNNTGNISSGSVTGEAIRTLQAYRRDWVATFWLVRVLNAVQLSPTLQVVMATNLPVNVCMVATIVTAGPMDSASGLSVGEMVLMGVLITAQTSLLATLCAVAIRLTGRLYGGHRALYRHCLYTPVKGRVKFGLLSVLYELTCTRRKCTFTIGPLGKVTKRAIYQFFYFYSASLMYAISQYRQQQYNINSQTL